jgi:GT2 family glycosyltransferase
MIARVLIRKNPKKPAGSKQLDWLVKSFAAVKKLRAGSGPSSADISVNVPVPQALVRRPNSRVRRIMRDELGSQFPGPNVAQKQDHWPAGAQLRMHSVEIFGFDTACQFFKRHGDHLEAAEQIGAEPLKIPAGNTTQFPRGLFLREGDLQIPPSEPPVLREQQPRAEAQKISQGEEEADRKSARDGRSRAIQKVNAEFEHAGPASRGRLNLRRSVNLPARCFNQYNVPVLPPPSPSIPSGFAQFVAQKFGPGPFLVIGAEREGLERQLENAKVSASVMCSIAELMESVSQNGNRPRVDLAIWFYSPEKRDDDGAAELLAACARDVLLLPGPGADIAKRRPQLVESFGRTGLVPDYGCDLADLDPGGLRLARKAAESADALVPVVESAFARLNRHVRGLERNLHTRLLELDAAERHISKLEEKLLKLKEAKQQLKQLKAEKHALRKSPERKIGQVLLAPYRLPQKLVREVRKRYPKAGKSGRSSGPGNEYQVWFEKHRVKARDFAILRQETQVFAYQPCISIVTPVFNTPIRWLEECVDSVLGQVYEKWELILVDDNSTDSDLLKFLPEIAARDPRIVVARVEQLTGISAASNRGIQLAQGEWIGFLDHDDVLEPDAIFEHVKWLQDHRDADLIYSDEDKLTEQGLDAPIFKPDWSPDYFLSCNYICHFTIIRRGVLEKVGGFRSEFDGAQDYDLFLRISEQTTRIDHVPRVLYHWRRSVGSTADNIRRKPGSLETGRLALGAHLERAGQRGHVTVDWRTHAYWIKRELAEAKRISIIIPVRDRVDLLARCLDSLTKKTSYTPYEIVIVDNDSESDETHAYLAGLRHRVLRYGGPFNYSAINNFAVEQTDSPWLLFLNNDTEVIEGDWLTIMTEHIQRSEVGAVGPRLLYPDDTVQHGGIVVGVGGIAEHAFRGFPAEAPGVCRQLQVTRNYSAVTGACLLTRRDVFNKVHGFDEERLPVTFSDVDLCLKIRRAGYLVVYTPFAKLYHHESGTRRRTVEPLEAEVMRERWAGVLASDPYYNPNLSRERADFSLGN